LTTVIMAVVSVLPTAMTQLLVLSVAEISTSETAEAVAVPVANENDCVDVTITAVAV
jgi:hypothetical protein